MPDIAVLIKPASGLCNMSCDYCFYADEKQKRQKASYGFMTEETLRNVIRKTISQSRQGISYAFQGGEPTLRGLDFFQKAMMYQTKYNKNHVPVYNSIQTNGLLIDEKWCGFLKENQFLVGLSADGIASVHDLYRHTENGGDTFARVRRAADLLQQYGVPFNILTVVTGDLAKKADKVYREYKKMGWDYQQYIACIEPLEEQKREQSYAAEPVAYGQFMIDLFEQWYADWKRGCQPYIRQFENYIAILTGRQAEACDQRGVCGIQTVVEADGGVYPCDFYVLDAYRMGNLNEEYYEEIRKKGETLGFVERSYNLSLSCRQCEYFSVCRGGCQRNREWNLSKETYENYFCEAYRMFFDKCFIQLQEIADSVREV
ncbi:MAG: anaerobic sulfatase maturase [Lachnospiraceae bacterium]|nr:anaerobic sulfatase maturase [Lachnospiraceae bacterium]